ncbi:MAG: hypothetical protein CXZ00_13635, partial [Acidobacteria bacterium]
LLHCLLLDHPAEVFLKHALVNRHRTAIVRYQHSRPIAVAISHGLINPQSTVFDYGCGHGEDVRLLMESGVSAAGWDPYHNASSSVRSADVVNLGYVLNVIEDAEERRNTLVAAYGLASRVLVVSVRVDRSLDTAAEYADGKLTRVGTFQKIYTQEEFCGYLRDVLGRTPHVVGLGIAYIFKEAQAEAQYLATLSFRGPQSIRQEAVEQFASDPLAQRYLARTRELARPPLGVEFPELPTLIEHFGSLDRIRRISEKLLNPATMHEAQESKRQNILTYLAMIKLQGLHPPPVSALPKDIQADIKSLWHSYAEAIAEGNGFLFRLGSPETVSKECRAAPIGKKLPEDLYVHCSIVDQLPPLLRLLTFAARQVIGEVDHDLVKISMHGRSVSFLKYRDFEEVAHPELEYSVRVFLPKASYTVRNYSNSDNPPILHRKESFVGFLHPRYSEFEALTKREDELGLLSRTDIGTRKGWLTVLSERNLRVEGHDVLADEKPAR